MAELVLSALLPVLFEKLVSTAVKNIARYKGIDADIKKWKRWLIQIQDVLTDASRKEITSQHVKRWLNDLHHLAYDIDDILDELATEAMHREFNHESEGINSKVRKLIPTCCTTLLLSASNTGVLDKLDKITDKLKELIEEKDSLGLIRVPDEPISKDKNRKLQTSMVDPSNIIGRQAEKEAYVHKLLVQGESGGQNFSIVPIIGMGGVGKTTLARLLYDEKEVNDHFELKAWICVSDEFDSFAISKVIFQSVAGENKDFEDLNLLQVALRDHLRGKRFLLVLDDVWSERCEDWEILVGPFNACAPGSKILMTTRKDKLLRKLGYNHLNQLDKLSLDDALSLIALHALGVNNFDSHLSLKRHAMGIVEKCGSLPLALKAIGRLLSTKKDEEYWKKILDSETWNLPIKGEIIPALKLSYLDLSPCLKQLFAYCSLFPKDCLFDKEELVLLWMAEGFLHESPPGDLTEESMGSEYFDELLSRSFFQHAPNNKSLFVMHDMMNDLATYVAVAGEFFVRLEFETKKVIGNEVLNKCRHMSFVREQYVTYKRFETLKSAKNLRTFIITSVGKIETWQRFYLSNKILVDLSSELPLLRVLWLSNFEISEVPDSIGTLRHLRYLNLSRTGITYLPENVCNLYNLQTLIVAGCRSLAKLPNNFLKLKKLRHLDMKDTPCLDQMPLGISELKSLQTLSKIIIGSESESGFEISKVKHLKNLCGEISFVGMEKVKKAIDAREANFSQKRFSELEVIWNDVRDGSRNEMLEKDVLNELKPCNDKLTRFKIQSYGGLEFPSWIADPLFFQLRHVSISECRMCSSLPPLGQLPLLKELFIKGLDGVKVVGLELFGMNGAFPSLEVLSFDNMKGWEKWLAKSEGVFPRVRQLIISDCPNLIDVTLETLPSLKVLDIITCDSSVLRRLVEVASATVTKVIMRGISGLDDVVWRGVIKYFGALEELRIHWCNEIRYLWESEDESSKVLMKLRKLEIIGCDNLVSLEKKEEEEDDDKCRSNMLSSLRMLYISNCKNMERCRCPNDNESLSVSMCSSVTTILLPTGGKLKSLDIDGCEKLSEREWGGQKANNNRSIIMPMLEYVRIYNWSNLKSIIELKYLVHLTKLKLHDCKSLGSFPYNELVNLTSLKELQITSCPSMDVSFGFWPPNLHSLDIGNLKKPILEWEPQKFPSSLVELCLYGKDEGSDGGVSSLDQISHLLPSSLTSLEINAFKKLESAAAAGDGMGLQHLTSLQHLTFWSCPNLKKLSMNLQHLTSIKRLEFSNCPNLSTLSHDPQHLTSLQHLSFYNCPKMKDLPQVLFPSLLSLQIWGGCSEDLKERCRKGGSYWPLISHIPSIDIR